MDTLYLVFKHQFQIVFGFALQTEKLRLKQTGTLPQYRRSVKRGLQFVRMLFFADKIAASEPEIHTYWCDFLRLPKQHARLKQDESLADTAASVQMTFSKITAHLFCCVRPVCQAGI
jgi:hypothetical protein